MTDRAERLSGLSERKAAYQMVFGREGATRVMEDLKRFCRAEQTCFHSDPRIHAALEGRREVWLRIQEHLTREVDELAEIYRAVMPEEGDHDDE